MLGPLQLIVIGFDEDKYARDIILELKNLRKSKTIRLFDLLYLFKHPDGTFEAKEVSDLEEDEQREFGTVVKSLIGLTGQQDLEHLDADNIADALEDMGDDFGLSDTELQTVADQLPNDSSAIFVLFEHTWARGVKEAMIKSGGTVRAQGFVDPDTLKVATNELATVLEAINRSETEVMEKMAEVITGAKTEQEEAKAQAAEAQTEAEAVTALAAAAMVEAKEKTDEAERVAAEALAREEEARRHAEELEEAARLHAEEVEEAARLRAEQAEAEAQAMEDEAFAEAEAVRRAATRQVERAEAEAAEKVRLAEEKAAQAVREAEEMEAQAVLRALNALVSAKVIERQAARPALDAVIAADIIDYAAARKAATTLSRK